MRHFWGGATPYFQHFIIRTFPKDSDSFAGYFTKQHQNNLFGTRKKYFQEVSGYNSAIDHYQKEIDNFMLNKTSLTRIASDMGDKVTTSQSSWRIRHFLHDNWLRKIPFSKESQRRVGLFSTITFTTQMKKRKLICSFSITVLICVNFVSPWKNNNYGSKLLVLLDIRALMSKPVQGKIQEHYVRT